MTSGPELPTYFLIILELLICILLYISYLCLRRYRCRQKRLHHSQFLSPTCSLISDESHDASIIDKLLPTFLYKHIKDQVLIELDKDGGCHDDDQEVELILECAVCFIPFEDDDIIRLVPICDHVFHRKCFDPWFKLHSTCPYCRVDLSIDDYFEEFSESEQTETVSKVDEDLETGKDVVILMTMLEQNRTGGSVEHTVKLPEEVKEIMQGESSCDAKGTCLQLRDGDGDGESMPKCSGNEMFERG